MTDNSTRNGWSRRRVLQTGAATTAGLGAIMASGKAPYGFVRGAWAEEAIGNFPVKGDTAVFGPGRGRDPPKRGVEFHRSVLTCR